MAKYAVPKLVKPPKAKKKQVLMVVSGDLRLSANQTCWAAQQVWLADSRKSPLTTISTCFFLALGGLTSLGTAYLAIGEAP
jgi:hypothetical protein